VGEKKRKAGERVVGSLLALQIPEKEGFCGGEGVRASVENSGIKVPDAGKLPSVPSGPP